MKKKYLKLYLDDLRSIPEEYHSGCFRKGFLGGSDLENTLFLNFRNPFPLRASGNGCSLFLY